MEYNFSPSELDYQPKKCQRCYYLNKRFKLSDGGRPPPVFSSLDANQKPYYKNINTQDWCEGLPEGVFIDKEELPGKITSEGLVDKKDRKFKLNGIPDIVIRLKEGGYAIYDFKTTNNPWTDNITEKDLLNELTKYLNINKDDITYFNEDIFKNWEKVY